MSLSSYTNAQGLPNYYRECHPIIIFQPPPVTPRGDSYSSQRLIFRGHRVSPPRTNPQAHPARRSALPPRAWVPLTGSTRPQFPICLPGLRLIVACLDLTTASTNHLWLKWTNATLHGHNPCYIRPFFSPHNNNNSQKNIIEILCVQITLTMHV